MSSSACQKLADEGAPSIVSIHISESLSGTVSMGIGFLALARWGVGFLLEALGDWQLARFTADPANKGKTLDAGVWRYTRHLNYFGDATQWWALYLIRAAVGGWWAIFSPIVFTALLIRVTGILRLEKSLVERKPQYRDYIESTSAFIPWFPRMKQ